mgnify:CR=1 FL=1
MNLTSRYKILISPLGKVEDSLLFSIQKEVTALFGFTTRISTLFRDLAFAFSPDRNQYNSTSILQRLSETLPPEFIKVLGITNVDLFIPVLTHVYGEAQLQGSASLISVYRLSENLCSEHPQDHFQNRVIKESLHELGHCFNLRHCKDNSCIMHYCRSTYDVDQKANRLCRYCRVFLQDEFKRLESNPV